MEIRIKGKESKIIEVELIEKDNEIHLVVGGEHIVCLDTNGKGAYAYPERLDKFYSNIDFN